MDEDNLPTEAVKKDDIRLVVDELNPDTEYWIIDAHNKPGSEFPSVPDVPSYSRPLILWVFLEIKLLMYIQKVDKFLLDDILG